jgi:very-short-patch-repair endonuclease
MNKIINDKKIICDYGCGQVAKYQFNNGKRCCSKSQNSCPSKKKRSAEAGIGKRHAFASPIETNKLCSFGCNQQAKFIYKNGSYCCSDDWHRCPNKRKEIQSRTSLIWSDLDRRKRLSETQRKDLFAVPIPVHDENKRCFYCGSKANFWFKTNDKYCCCDRIERCPVVRNEISNRSKELWKNDKFRKKVMNQDYNDPERLRKMSQSIKKWCRENRDFIIQRNKKIADDRRGKTYEEIYGEEKALLLKEKAKQRFLGKTYKEIYGEEKAKQIKENTSNRLLGKTHVDLYGDERAKEISQDMSKKKKDHWQDPNSSYNSEEFRKRKSIEGKNKWKDPEYTAKVQKSLHKSPNKIEEFLITLINNLGLEYEFVGDWSLNINGRNPDFIDLKKKKIIEHFGVYYHDTIVDKTREEHENERIQFFTECGYETLIIWEDELDNIDKVVEKILNFDSI